MLSSRLIIVSGFVLIAGCGTKPHVTAWHTPNQPEIVEYVKVLKVGGRKDSILTKRIRYYSNGQMADNILIKSGVPQGKYQSWWSNGNPKIAGQYDLGYRNKKWVFKSENGSIDSIRNYNNDVYNGEIIDNYSTGSPKSIKYYAEGVLHGKFQQYDKNHLRISGTFNYGQKNGEWIWISADGNRDSVRTFLDGLLDGDRENYSDEGVLIHRKTYRSNKLEGPVEEFYPNGSKKLKGSYQKEIPHDAWTWWNEDGNPIRTITYQNGVKHGKYSIFEESKKRSQTGEYNLDERHGKWIWYNTAGKIDSVIEFANGIKSGEYSKWHRNNEKSVVGQFASGMMDGKWIWFDSNGEIDSLKTYNNGQLDGDMELYHTNGELSIIQSYSMGLKSGRMKSYYSNGQQDSEWTYVDGKRHGPYTVWSRSGEIQESGSYLHDILDGLIERHFSSGGQSSVATYNDGILHGVLRVFNTSGNVVKEQYYLHGILACEFKNYSDGTRKYASVLHGDTIIYEENWDKYGQDQGVESTQDIEKNEDYYISGIVKLEKKTSDNISHGVHWGFNEDRSVNSIIVYDQGSVILKRGWNRSESTSSDTLFHSGHCINYLSNDTYLSEPDIVLNKIITETQ
ncbi:MAG: hypothetical protein HQ509_09330 [Candidatus Marinimicrobia bacterium]|nr:hypothetical protein [Candidatus Neomarinimicrobiota bacterium]